MPNYRGSNIVLLRKLLKGKSENETAFLARLDAKTQDVYASILPGSWVPIPVAEVILKAAAEVLFPGDANPYLRLGYQHAQKNVNGLYKSFLRFLSPAVVIENSGKVWRLLFDAGEHEYTLDKAKCSAVMVVRNFPELPLVFRELANGHIHGTMGLTGAKNIRLQRDDSNPRAWRWWGSWA